jgi:hypothetical protein
MYYYRKFLAMLKKPLIRGADQFLSIPGHALFRHTEIDLYFPRAAYRKRDRPHTAVIDVPFHLCLQSMPAARAGIAFEDEMRF